MNKSRKFAIACFIGAAVLYLISWWKDGPAVLGLLGMGFELLGWRKLNRKSD